jgi:serine/threonine-protein kinase
MLQPGTVLDSKYQIEAVIGQGGFGHVYRARERLTGEAVAIKELVPTFVHNPEMVKRFVQEARATLRLKHGHIARTYGIFQDQGTYYLAMEYLAGGSLADRLNQGPLAIDQAADIAADLCGALHYAHERGVVHCDIKPANVLFDEAGQAQLVDFGIAYVSTEMMTRQFHTAAGMAMGTVQYMAPEQLAGVRDDPRIDIYAMGVLLYRMVAGRPYLGFQTETTPAAQARNIALIQQQQPRPLREVRPDAPSWLAETVDKALRKRPEERFATAQAMREALQGRQREHPGRGPALRAAPVRGGGGQRRGPEERPGSRGTPARPGAARRPDLSRRATTVSEPEPAAPPPEESSDRRGGCFLRGLPAWILILGALAGLALACLILMLGIIGAGAEEMDPASSSPAPPTGDLSKGDRWTRASDEKVMVYVPAGNYHMGSDDEAVAEAMAFCDEYSGTCERWRYEVEQPRHRVTLDAFWIDQTEITHGEYAACIRGGDCPEPQASLAERERAEGQHPVTGIDWHAAGSYCAWAGGRLPTEAEWEFAARGPEEHTFPWGDEFDGTRLNFCDVNCPEEESTSAFDDGYELTAPVGTYADGASWCGALDMAGNVHEWVADWRGPYDEDDQENPTGPSSAENKVVRGGSYNSSPAAVRSAWRGQLAPKAAGANLGFRCVWVSG